jgi:hypothetical protein
MCALLVILYTSSWFSVSSIHSAARVFAELFLNCVSGWLRKCVYSLYSLLRALFSHIWFY